MVTNDGPIIRRLEQPPAPPDTRTIRCNHRTDGDSRMKITCEICGKEIFLREIHAGREINARIEPDELDLVSIESDNRIPTALKILGLDWRVTMVTSPIEGGANDNPC